MLSQHEEKAFHKGQAQPFIGLGNSQKPKSKISGQKICIINYHGYESVGYPLNFKAGTKRQQSAFFTFS